MKLFVLIPFFFIPYISIQAQSPIEVQDPIGIWIKIKNPNPANVPHVDEDLNFHFEDSEKTDFFNRNSLTKFSLAFPSILKVDKALRNGLDKYYELECECDYISLKDSLSELFREDYSYIELIPDPEKDIIPIYTLMIIII